MNRRRYDDQHVWGSAEANRAFVLFCFTAGATFGFLFVLSSVTR